MDSRVDNRVDNFGITAGSLRLTLPVRVRETEYSSVQAIPSIRPPRREGINAPPPRPFRRENLFAALRRGMFRWLRNAT